MGRSWQIAKIKGIPILLHWTLGLFLMFFIWFAVRQSMDTNSLIFLGLFIFSLFFCILLHEFGHALTAQGYGVKTRDIILSPIGGLARLESIPENPRKEFLIAINGPLVNLVIAIVVGIIIYVSGQEFLPPLTKGQIRINQASFLPLIMLMNIGVFLFNLIPAFPMDGGRILRSILSIKMGRLRATFWSAFIGRVIAIGFVVFAVFNGLWTLALIGPFIFFMAGQEYRQVSLNQKLMETDLEVVTRRNFTKVYDEDMVDRVLSGSTVKDEYDYLVFNEEEELSGSLPYLFIEEIRNNPDEYDLIKNIKSKNKFTLDIRSSVGDAFQIMKSEGITIFGVTQENQIIGVVDRPAISKYIASVSKIGFLS